MSGDFSEQDRRGLVEWLDAWGDVPDRLGAPDRRDVRDGSEVPDQRGGPAYVVSFGWLPARLPPAAPSAQGSVGEGSAGQGSAVAEALIPVPRRAIEDRPGWGEPR
jgi:hypothetical protein